MGTVEGQSFLGVRLGDREARKGGRGGAGPDCQRKCQVSLSRPRLHFDVGTVLLKVTFTA